MKNNLGCSTPEDSLGPNDSLVYLKLEHTPAWAQQHTRRRQELFTRSVFVCKCMHLYERDVCEYDDECAFTVYPFVLLHPSNYGSYLSVFSFKTGLLRCVCVCICSIEICCYRCYQDLNRWCAIKPRICFVQLCSFTDETSAGNKAEHIHINTYRQ